tara:strand:- start:265 stop:588 length:324 start_codon:yes stop_codon:yes gene_type:complete
MMMIPMQPGGEKEARMKLLFEFTKLSESTQEMLLAHFVKGVPIEHCVVLFNMAQPNVSRAIKNINDVNHIVEQVKAIDLYHIADMKKNLTGVACSVSAANCNRTGVN